MIIIHSDPTNMESGSRIIRPPVPKDWVRFDSEEELFQIDKGSNNRLNVQVDMSSLDSVEISFVKKFRKNQVSKKFFSGEVLQRNLDALKLSMFYYERGEFSAEVSLVLFIDSEYF